MRKLLINSTAIATVAALTASVAVAEITKSFSGSTEMKYKSRTSSVAATNGTNTVSDSNVTFKFGNKTNEGLNIEYTVNFTAEGGATTTDESSFSVEGGFGKVVMGENDGAGDTFGISAVDLVAEESTDSVVSARMSYNADLVSGNSDATKIAYFLPPMNGFAAGVSQADNGAVSGADTTSMGFSYEIDAGEGTSITFGGATTTTGIATTKDTNSNNVGIKFVSGPLKVTVAQGTFDAVDEDRKSTDVGVSYTLDNGIVLGAYMVSASDDDDAGEAYDASGIEAQYTIAAGLTAVVNMNDYDYKVGNNADADMSAVGDKGTSTTLTIKAAF